MVPAAGRAELFQLYRRSLRAAQQFETYNFRKYFYRRTRDRFRALAALTDAAAAAEAMAAARAELEVVQRQGAVNRMFAQRHTVIETDPRYASGARRFAE
ncbi:hypothetical protein LPJ61_002157 [Coemansia biformis]|uniref:Complex 1 LYR protein domain-containing protein n=1 Tax=Coemansia biformis TaxID=1286918 RepID=A0A9W7YDK8_9FUNG|nr:hypothetical protein LPJ61_002157 [Coemansia biformis]